MMAKRWFIVALIGLGICCPQNLRAQVPGYTGAPYGHQPGMAEPTPIAKQPIQNAPCPPNFTAVPPVTLPNDGSPNAFATAPCMPDHGLIFSVGALGLERQRLGHSLLAVRDPSGIENGGFPPKNLPAFLDTSDLDPEMSWGFRITGGYRWGGDVVEVTGFYLPQASSFASRALAGGIDVPFATSTIPAGFQGVNNLWLQADLIQIELEQTLGNLEVNYRKGVDCGLEWIFGVRWLDIAERVNIFTSDNGALTEFDPMLAATYSARTHNRILAPQFGVEGEWPICHWLAVGGVAKGAWGVNWVSTSTSLIRDDGFVSPQRPEGGQSLLRFGQVYELNVFLDLLIAQRCRLRGGYQMLWAVGVAEAVDQVSFNLAELSGAEDRTTGSIFYHGPMIELHIGF